jgi:hypothetical protein
MGSKDAITVAASQCEADADTAALNGGAHAEASPPSALAISSQRTCCTY